MKITTTHESRSEIVKMRGRLDAKTASILQDELERLAKKGRHNIALEMSEVEFVSSRGLRVLSDTHILAKKHGGKLVLVNVNERVRASLDWAGLKEHFEIFDDLALAVGSF